MGEMPDRHGYDARQTKRGFEVGDPVYVVDLTHAWAAIFAGYMDGSPYVQTVGGEIVRVDPATLRRPATLW